MLSVNVVSILVAAIVAFLIGFLLHGPILGKLWMRLADIHPTGNEKLSDMMGQMVANLVVNFITALGLAVLLLLTSSSPLLPQSRTLAGVICGVTAWLFFNLTANLIDVIWMSKNFKLWLYEAFASLIVFIAMGGIIGFWP